MSDRWNADDVEALAPDAPSWKAARTTSRPGAWEHAGLLPGDALVVWGECRGSGSRSYRVAVHVDADQGPACTCSCPSRKTPCKHALGLLVRWTRDELAEADASPEWAGRWIARRTARRARPAAPDPARAEAARREREHAVAEGLAELSLWLRDQVGSGLSEAPSRGYDHWDRMAERLVDAKAAGAAALVSGLPALARHRDWPERVLERFALLHLLAEAHRAREHLPDTLRAAVRARIGVTTRADEVLAHGERVADTWTVLARSRTHDPASGVWSRRVWLRGCTHGRTVVTLAHGRDPAELDGGPEPGTRAEAELALYPDAHRATEVHTGPCAPAPAPPGSSVAGALDTHAAGLAQDPWLEASLVVLAAVVPARREGRWYLADPEGGALPLTDPEPWRLLAATGAHPATVVGEWSPAEGFTPLTVWADGTPAVAL
ncbi:SWIM zinc finger family protein [Nocardiopsis sp. HNM0947]|uniref:SWIM zinc finger family protein n=1 Tax=Nocardiopsis coralli TaxID=2772213 RepID=A0ABR9P390_9ACTN|nr:SWIM zinc finger family protein [Nocardiopsis coralli]MBE2998291.1 SWIM zinc finger family protein [Nocardiopsis coralli]